MKIEWIDPHNIKIDNLIHWKDPETPYADLILEIVQDEDIPIPLVITHDNQLIDGYYRRVAAIRLGIKLVPVVRIPYAVKLEEINMSNKASSAGITKKEIDTLYFAIDNAKDEIRIAYYINERLCTQSIYHEVESRIGRAMKEIEEALEKVSELEP